MDKLVITTEHAVRHVAFGWFNLTWPNIGFWIAVIVVFVVFAWMRIPRAMEADAKSRKKAKDS